MVLFILFWVLLYCELLEDRDWIKLYGIIYVTLPVVGGFFALSGFYCMVLTIFANKIDFFQIL